MSMSELSELEFPLCILNTTTTTTTTSINNDNNDNDNDIKQTYECSNNTSSHV